MFKALLVMAVISGLILGPGYWVYAKLFSGKLVSTIDLAIDGEGRINSPRFRIDPSLKPVGLVFSAYGEFSPNRDEDKPPKDGYTATLTMNGKTLLTSALTLPATSVQESNPVFKERLFWLEAADSGDYRLDIVPIGKPEIRLDNVRLEIRANMQEPDGRVVSAGLLLAIFGLLGLFM